MSAHRVELLLRLALNFAIHSPGRRGTVLVSGDEGAVAIGTLGRVSAVEAGRAFVVVVPLAAIVAAVVPGAFHRVAVPLASRAVDGNRRLLLNSLSGVTDVEESEGSDRPSEGDDPSDLSSCRVGPMSRRAAADGSLFGLGLDLVDDEVCGVKDLPLDVGAESGGDPGDGVVEPDLGESQLRAVQCPHDDFFVFLSHQEVAYRQVRWVDGPTGASRGDGGNFAQREAWDLGHKKLSCNEGLETRCAALEGGQDTPVLPNWVWASARRLIGDGSSRGT